MKRKLWAAPHNLTSRFGEKFFARSRFEKRGNTACISSFSNRRLGEKDPSKRAGAIARCCLSTLLLALALLTGVSTAARAADVSGYERQVVSLVNAERAQYSLPALTLNSDLSAYARVKSDDLRAGGYFSHESPTYGSPFAMMQSFGVSYTYAGENIAMGYDSPAAVVSAWMNSPSHRANILSASFTQTGVGYAANGGYWTQWFIG